VTNLGRALADLVARHGGRVEAEAVDHAVTLLHAAAVEAPGALPARQIATLRAAKFVARHVNPGLWQDPATRAVLKAEVQALVDRHAFAAADVHDRG
jgi:hypothetical protein